MAMKDWYRPAMLLLVGVLLGSLLGPPIVNAATRERGLPEAAPASQVVLAKGECLGSGPCTTPITGCGIIGAIVMDGATTGPAALTASSGPNLWYDQSPSGHVNEMFNPGLRFQEDLTFGIHTASGVARFFVYGNHTAC
jgi:hypothetical protein